MTAVRPIEPLVTAPAGDLLDSVLENVPAS
jgi:hypothetical protein